MRELNLLDIHAVGIQRHVRLRSVEAPLIFVRILPVLTPFGRPSRITPQAKTFSLHIQNNRS